MARSVIVAKAISRNTRAPAVFIIIARTSRGDGGGGTRAGEHTPPATHHERDELSRLVTESKVLNSH